MVLIGGGYHLRRTQNLLVALQMSKKSKDEYFVLFRGVKISKCEANRIGVGLIFGFVGAIISTFLIGPENRIVAIIVCILFVAIGYFWVGNKIFKT